jgi:7,8-dihydroneopterin aldolase/epimerase/oxygenase
MDNMETTFGPLHLRAQGEAADMPADRISLRDYVRMAEIGAYACERGVEQRLRFNVVLEVTHHAAAHDDDVDQVVSYDMIVEAIDRLLSRERLDLLETLAERLAQICLGDKRVLRAYVRVEKLDRVPGALGVEIVRRRIGPELPRIRPVVPTTGGARPSVDVIYLGDGALGAGETGAWLSAIAARGRPAVLCVGPRNPVAPAETPNARRIGYLDIEARALELADLDSRFGVVATRSEIEWSLGAGIWPIWAPARMADSARSADVPDASQPETLAAWLGEVIDGRLILVGSDGEVPEGAVRLPAGHPDLLQEV